MPLNIVEDEEYKSHLQQQFTEITGLTFNIIPMIENVKSKTDDEKIAFLKKLMWWMPEGYGRDYNVRLVQRDYEFLNNVAHSIGSVRFWMERLATDTDNDMDVDMFDVLTAHEPKPKANEIWYRTSRSMITDELEKLYTFNLEQTTFKDLIASDAFQEVAIYNGPDIIDEYAAKDNRIKAIHKKKTVVMDKQ